MKSRRRRKGGLVDVLLEVAIAMPWWLAILIALVTWFGLHHVVDQHSIESPLSGVDGVRDAIWLGYFIAIASVGQYVLPIIFGFGATISFFSAAKRKKLHRDVMSGSKSIQSLDWKAFEYLVGESFRRDGYDIALNDSPGPDGGVDVTLRKNGELFLVQCKHWRAFKVGVAIVRELYGVMASRGATGGYVITSGSFTEDAKAFAVGRNITLMDGRALTAWLMPQALVAPRPQEVKASAPESPLSVPQCPVCQKPMIKRVAKKGANSGNAFWGCSMFPACRGVKAIND